MVVANIVRESTACNPDSRRNAGTQNAWLPGMMSTDVKETDLSYEMEISLPGIKKENIRMQLENGYLTIGAQTADENSDTSAKEKYIRRERFQGKMMRSFYVGDEVKETDIHPRYENGILSFSIPKKEQIIEENQQQYITIE